MSGAGAIGSTPAMTRSATTLTFGRGDDSITTSSPCIDGKTTGCAIRPGEVILPCRYFAR